MNTPNSPERRPYDSSGAAEAEYPRGGHPAPQPGHAPPPRGPHQLSFPQPPGHAQHGDHQWQQGYPQPPGDVRRPAPGTFTPAQQEQGPKRRRRTVSVSTVVTLLLGLPWLLCSMVILILAASFAAMPFTDLGQGGSDWVGEVIGWAVLIGFPLSGALPLWRPAENVIARVFFRYRPPTPQERALIEPLWDAVTRRAGIEPQTYSLWVQDSDEVNAYAGAGRTVGVTRFSLTQLGPQHLEAVLAHELGHHLGGHPWPRMMVYWYSLPTRMVLRAAALMTRALLGLYSVTIGAMFVAGSRNVGVAALVGCSVLLIPLFCVMPIILPLLPLALAPPIEAWFDRRSELYADKVAADLGYGPVLADLFQLWQAQGYDDDYAQAGTAARMMSTHPPLHARIRTIQRRLQRDEA